jgi:hypothetical protein
MRYQKRYAMVTRRANPDEWEQLAVVAIVYCSVRVLISDEYVTNVLGSAKAIPRTIRSTSNPSASYYDSNNAWGLTRWPSRFSIVITPWRP